MRRALGMIAALLVAAMAALLLVVDTPWFERILAAQVVSVVNAQIRGRVEIGRLGIGLRSVRLEGVSVTSPGGVRVVEVERAIAQWDRWPMADGAILVPAVRVEGGTVRLDSAEGGDLHLSEAFAARAPSTADTSPPVVSIDELVLDRVDLLRDDETLAGAIAAKLWTRIESTGIAVQGEISADPRGWDRRVSAGIDGSLSNGWRDLSVARLTVTSGGSAVSLRGEADLAAMEAKVSGIDALLSPGELALALPGAAGLDEVRIQGDAALARGLASATLEVEQGSNRVLLDGELALLTGSWKATARSAALDPRSMDADLPPAILDGLARASGVGGDVREVRLEGVSVRLGEARAGPIEAELEKRGDGWRVERFAGSFPGAELHGSGQVGYETASLRFRLEARQLERTLAAVDAWADALGFERPGLSGVSGALTADGRVEGRLDAPAITAHVRAPRIVRGDLSVADLEIDGRYAGLPGRQKAKVAGRIGAIAAGGSGAEAIRLDLELGGGRARGRVEGRSPLGPIGASLDAAVSPDLSRLRFDELALEWPGARWSLKEDATIALGPRTSIDAAFEGSRGGEVRAKVSAGGGRWNVDASGAAVSFEGLPPFLGLAELGLTGAISFDARLSSERFAVDASIERVELGAIRALGGAVQGHARVGARAEGTWAAPSIEVSLEAPAFDLKGVEGFGVLAGASWPGPGPSQEVTMAYTVSRNGEELADGSLRLEGGVADLPRWRDLPLHASASMKDIALEKLAELLPARLDVAGRGDLAVKLEGTATRPRFEVDGALRNASWEGRELGDASLHATSRDSGLAATLRASSRAGGVARIDASLGVDLGIEAFESGRMPSLGSAPLDAQVQISGAEVGILRAFLPDLRQLAGTVDAAGSWKGTLADPRVEGTVSLREGRIGHERIGELREIELELEARPDRLILRKFGARSSGTIHVSGEAVRSRTDGPWSLDLSLSANRFAVVSNDAIRAFLDAQGRLTGSATARLLDADLEIASGGIRLPDRPGRSIQSLEPHPDFHVVVTGAEPPRPGSVETSDSDAFQVRLHVTTARPVLLEGIDLSIAAMADLRLFHDAEGLRLTGGVETTRGNLLVMGRRFDLQRGRVSYLGTEPLGSPRLEVTAVQESPHAQVTVTIGGTAQKPTADLRSNPPMSEAEIATLLATGRPQLKHGAGGVSEASGAATALGAVVTSQLRRGIAAKLPVDVISVQAGEEGLETGSLEAGSYVTDRIYVGYSRNFGVLESDRRNANEVRVEYQLHRQWTLEVTYGDRGAGDAGVFWKRDFN